MHTAQQSKRTHLGSGNGPSKLQKRVVCEGLSSRNGRCKRSIPRAQPPAAHRSNGAAQAACVTIISALSGLLDPSMALAALDSAGKYVPEPYTPGPEVWAGAVAAAIPFVIGSWEFGKRILIQQRCERCGGSGLIQKRRYRDARDVRKCPDCGGFFPWQGWKLFFTSTAAPGNGGPLQQPKGQTSVFYRVPDKPKATRVEKAAEVETSRVPDGQENSK